MSYSKVVAILSNVSHISLDKLDVSMRLILESYIRPLWVGAYIALSAKHAT